MPQKTLQAENPVTGKTVQKIVRALDQEFIFGKGRKLSLKKRYPGLFERKNYKNLFFIGQGEEIYSFVAVKTLNVKDAASGNVLRLFLIGCVYTPSYHRGNGYSSLLLKQVTNRYLESGFDAGLLWTTQHGFYERLGWKVCENGVFVAMKSLKKLVTATNRENQALTVKKFRTEGQNVVERLRRSNTTSYLIDRRKTSVNAHYVVPSPAVKTNTFAVAQGNKPNGYCVAGFQGKSAYIYELAGKDENGNLKLISHLAGIKGIQNIYLNLPSWQKMPAVCVQLSTEYSITPQRLQMVFVKKQRLLKTIQKVYIPLIDRV